MKSWVAIVSAVTFLSFTTIAQAESLGGRIAEGVGGAVSAGGSIAVGMGHIGLDALYHGVYALGVPAAASPAVLGAGTAVALGAGTYALTRAIVGHGTPLKEGLPGMVSGTVVLGVFGPALVHAIAVAAATAAIGTTAAVVGAGIGVAIGVGLLGYGIYRLWKAHKEAVASKPANPPINLPTVPAPGGRGNDPGTTGVGSNGNGGTTTPGVHHPGPILSLPGMGGRGGSGTNVGRNVATRGTGDTTSGGRSQPTLGVSR